MNKNILIQGDSFVESFVFKKSSYNLFKNFSEKSSTVNKFLDGIGNPYLFFDLHADYEVIGQYQILEIDNKNRNEIKDLFIKISKEYPIQFFKLSLNHYFGLWFPGGKQIFLYDYIFL